MRHLPRSVSNEVDDAVFLASNYGLTPDDWQEDVLESWLGRRADGRWAAPTCGLAVPRQNGKNAIIEVRELFGMVALGEKFLHTAHEVKTARKAFRRISSFFENEREYPELAALAVEIRKTNGQEAVVLSNGGSVEFIARSKGSGRGYTVDVLVCDEAQDLVADELEALLPTISAAPLGNPQKIYTGTPPKPEREQGEVFRSIRAAGEARSDARLAWTDFGVADGPLPDVDDRGEWVARNPGVTTRRLNVEEIEGELLLLTPEGFARERLGWWGDPALIGTGTIPPEPWHAGLTPAPADAPAAFSVDMTWDRDWATVGVCAAGYVDVVEHSKGAAWVVNACSRLQQAHPDASFWVHPKGPAGVLIEPLRLAGVRVQEITAEDYPRACVAFYDAVIRGDLPHSGHPALNAAVAGAMVRGGETWVWDRKHGAVISPLIAVTLARWAWERGRGNILNAVW